MAPDLADDVLWYWHRRDEAAPMLETVRTAVEAEFERDRSLGHDTALLGVSLDDFETYHGRLQMYARVDMRLMRHGLLPISWSPAFRSTDQVRKWFRSNRPAWREMARLRDERAKVGAVGAIDTVALNALRHAGWVLRMRFGYWSGKITACLWTWTASTWCWDGGCRPSRVGSTSRRASGGTSESSSSRTRMRGPRCWGIGS